MSRNYNRRQIIGAGIGSLAALSAFGLAGCGDSQNSSTQNSAVQLQMVFWGAASRNKLTRQAISLFEKSHSNITISSQFTGFDAYWNKLSTEIAGGSEPDLIQMDMRYLAQYVQKGLLLDLTSLISNKTIDLSDFDQVLLNSSKANDKVYGVPMGGNYQCMIYDTVLLQKSGVGAPPDSFTWESFADYATKLSKALGNGVFGSEDQSGGIVAFEVWVRQRGKEIYTTDGKLGFDVNDVTDWFNYWSNLRKAGGCVPTDVQTSLGGVAGPASSTIIRGKAVINFTFSNIFDAYQKLTTDKLAMHQYPNSGSTPGMYLKPSMLLSISSKTKYSNQAASFVNYINNNADAVKALGLDRGVPGSAKARATLNPQLTPAQQAITAYVDLVSKSGNASAKKVLDPAGAGQVEQALLRAGQNVGFGKASVTDGAKAFYDDAQKAVAQA